MNNLYWTLFYFSFILFMCLYEIKTVRIKKNVSVQSNEMTDIAIDQMDR